MSPCKFNLICIATLVAVVALAMFMVGTGPAGSGLEAPVVQSVDAGGAETAADPLMIQPLSLGLSLAIVVDMGLMTLGLVILFKDDAPARYRVR